MAYDCIQYPSYAMLCSKWTSHCISHLRLRLRCDNARRNPSSQSKSTIVCISLKRTRA